MTTDLQLQVTPPAAPDVMLQLNALRNPPMTTEFIWLAEQLHVAPSLDGLENVIQTVDWRLNALAADGLSATCYGTVALANPEPQAFAPFEGLTEEMVVGWVKAAFGDEVGRLEASLTGEIEKRRNPPVVVMAPPWAA